MPLIHVFGASGAGTTTMGRAIASSFGYVHLDTDDFFWEPTDPPFQRTRPVEERAARLHDVTGQDGFFVLTGSLCGWGDFLIPRFDLAIRLVTPTDIRIKRLQDREKSRFGDRVLPGGDMYDNHREFIDWAATYDAAGLDQRSRARHDQWSHLLCCPCLVMDGARPMSDLIKELEPHIPRKPTPETGLE
jgi:adenylate kinase family enzyme